MSHLPVIVGFGGVNSAGRSSFHHGYRRLVIDKLDSSKSEETYLNLAVMMGLLKYDQGKYFDTNGSECLPNEVSERFGPLVRDRTLLRKISPDYLDVEHIPTCKKVKFQNQSSDGVAFTISKRDLPNALPPSWTIKELEGSNKVEVMIQGDMNCLCEDERRSLVQTAGQLPTGFNPGKLYSSKNHPRSLQMTLYGASDAINSMGIDWQTIQTLVPPDQIGVYASSSMGQLDEFGIAGYMKAGALGKRTSSKQLAMSFAEMPADFINAYVLGSVGHTGGMIGACASFLYNLNVAIRDIQTGKRRVAIVGNSEAPITPEVIEGYRVMSALAEDAQILALDKDKGLTETDHRRACRPFGYNCGFTLAESSQYFILFDDALAVELGAQILGSVGDIFINSDGIKKSISAPGVGNYITIAKAAAAARAIVGEESLRHRSYIHAHGTGTPQNRVTESHGLDMIAKAFNISNWPVAAVKCYLGHSIGTAAGDQLAASLGTWAYGLIPGTFTLDQVADDVHHDNLKLTQDHQEVGPEGMDSALINTKGFGGNNATGVILSPHVTMRMLEKRHGKQAIKSYREKSEPVLEKAKEYDQSAIKQGVTPTYRFGERVLNGEDLELTDQKIAVPGFDQSIDLNMTTPYADMGIES